MTEQTAVPPRAAGYVRVSQERAARNGYGLAAQEHEIRKFTGYKDLDLVEVYREEGVSGYRRDRPALERLLADAKAGRFAVAVFPSIARAGTVTPLPKRLRMAPTSLSLLTWIRYWPRVVPTTYASPPGDASRVLE